MVVDKSCGAAISIRVVTEFVDESPQNLDRWFEILIFYLERIF